MPRGSDVIERAPGVALQVSLPLAQVEGCPMGLGIIGPRGSDEALLDLAVDVMQKFV